MAREILIEQHTSPVRVVESDQPGVFTFEAVVSQADFLNRNRRLYPEDVLFPAFDALNALISRNLAQPGLVDHPNWMDSSSVASIGVAWERFFFEGKTVIGRGRIVPTQRGKDLQAAIEAGIAIGFSTRGYGETEEFDAPDGKPARRMLPGYELETVDAVCDPSVLHARVRSFTKEETDKMEKELEELRALVEQLQAELAEAEQLKAEVAEAREKLAGFESDAESRSSVIEGLNSTIESLTAENVTLTEKVAELEGTIAELRAAAEEAAKVAAENTLTVRLHELTEGHRFAQTIINNARELGVSLETVEKVVETLKTLVEAAGAAANTEAAPRGDTSTEEDAENEEPAETEGHTAKQLEELRDAKLITESEYEKRLARLA